MSAACVVHSLRGIMGGLRDLELKLDLVRWAKIVKESGAHIN